MTRQPLVSRQDSGSIARHIAHRARPLIALVLLAGVACGGTGGDSAPPTGAATATPSATASAPAEGHFPTDAEILAILEDRVDSGRSVGIVVGLLEPDGSRRYLAYGDAGPDALPLSAQSVFEIGSITKVFTAILLADMVSRGELSLDDPVAGFLPGDVTVPSRDGAEISLAHLATHRSGLPRMPDNFAPADAANPFADYTVAQLYEFLSGYELPRDVGAQFEYSNVAVGLLGHVLAQRAGMDYEALVRERILAPLGMGMSGIELTPAMREQLVAGHNAVGDVVSNWDIPTLAGAGALRSNAEDMLTFLEANIGAPSTPLEESMRLTHEPREAAGGDQIGLNWIIRTVGDDRIVWHNGGTGGYRTFAGFDPAAGVGAVVLTNSGGAGADDIGFHLINPEVPLAAAPTAAEERTAVEVSEEILAAYVGVYELTPEFRITVTLEEGQLHVQATGQQKFPIFAESETEFFLRVVDAQVTFVRDEAGEATALILHQGGADQTATKIASVPS